LSSLFTIKDKRDWRSSSWQEASFPRFLRTWNEKKYSPSRRRRSPQRTRRAASANHPQSTRRSTDARKHRRSNSRQRRSHTPRKSSRKKKQRHSAPARRRQRSVSSSTPKPKRRSLPLDALPENDKTIGSNPHYNGRKPQKARSYSPSHYYLSDPERSSSAHSLQNIRRHSYGKTRSRSPSSFSYQQEKPEFDTPQARKVWNYSSGSQTPSTTRSRRSSLAIEKQKQQSLRLQSYKPRVSFDSLSIKSRPLGVKLCSNDGRYLEIVDVDEGGAGDRAGIIVGDLIVQINDDCFESAQEGLSMVKNYPLPLELHVRRILDGEPVPSPSVKVESSGASSTATGGSTTRDSSQFSVLEAAKDSAPGERE